MAQGLGFQNMSLGQHKHPVHTIIPCPSHMPYILIASQDPLQSKLITASTLNSKIQVSSNWERGRPRSTHPEVCCCPAVSPWTEKAMSNGETGTRQTFPFPKGKRPKCAQSIGNSTRSEGLRTTFIGLILCLPGPQEWQRHLQSLGRWPCGSSLPGSCLYNSVLWILGRGIYAPVPWTWRTSRACGKDATRNVLGPPGKRPPWYVHHWVLLGPTWGSWGLSTRVGGVVSRMWGGTGGTWQKLACALWLLFWKCPPTTFFPIPRMFSHMLEGQSLILNWVQILTLLSGTPEHLQAVTLTTLAHYRCLSTSFSRRAALQVAILLQWKLFVYTSVFSNVLQKLQQQRPHYIHFCT
jgi:hypothetical protein